MSTESINDLKKWVTEVIRQSSDGEFVGLNRVVDMVSKNFAVHPHEVAILVITEDDRFLRFVVPEKLRQVGQIPLTSTNSLAARTVREKRPETAGTQSLRRDSDFAQRQDGGRRRPRFHPSAAARIEISRGYSVALRPAFQQAIICSGWPHPRERRPKLFQLCRVTSHGDNSGWAFRHLV